jgi:hypothetical protein
MRTLLAFFVFTTVALAATTAYFARQLHAREAPAVPISISPPTSHRPDERPASLAPASPGALSSSQSEFDAGRAKFDAGVAAVRAERKARDVQNLMDPVKRAALLEQRKKTMRAYDPRLGAYLGLNDAELDAFNSFLAEQQLASQEESLRCTEPSCRSLETIKASGERSRIAIADFLGSERSERYTQYEQTRSERADVDRFRAGLPDKLRMSDEQYEQLIVVLADERRSFERKAQSRGLGWSAFGYILYDETQRSDEERLAAGREYAERLQARASAVLTTEQAREYARSWEAGLATMEGALPEMESLDAHGIQTIQLKH